jgi:hypothetical protein
MILVVVGGIAWFIYGATSGRINLVERIFGRGRLGRVIFYAVGIATLLIMFDRDTYLPFLGETVLPSGALPEKTPERWTEKVTVDVEPNSKVVFWAAEPGDHGEDPVIAYKGYENAGVTISSADGKADLKVRSPQSYSVPVMGNLASHIHYRVFTGPGILGPVKSVQLRA